MWPLKINCNHMKHFNSTLTDLPIFINFFRVTTKEVTGGEVEEKEVFCPQFSDLHRLYASGIAVIENPTIGGSTLQMSNSGRWTSEG